jgi:hypothetical protein
VKGEASSFEPPRAAIAAGFAGATAAEVVLAAQQYMRQGSVRAAVALCEAARERGLADPALSLSLAMGRFASGERATGLALVESVLASEPENLGALSLKAHMVASLGNAAEGRELLLRVVSAYPDYPGALPFLSALVFPGPPYREVLARLHRALAPDTYLEIGVDTGSTLALATTATRAVGVDPEPSIAAPALPPNARLYQLESDAFFAGESRASVFDGRAVDLTFVDGMHWFEYALRDFANAERWSNEKSTIVLHDCIPVVAAAAARERGSVFWVGDVWKALEGLLDYRPELRISVVPTSPSGLVIARGLDPDSRVLFEKHDEIVSRYREAVYPRAPGEWHPRLRVVENSEAGVKEAIGG